MNKILKSKKIVNYLLTDLVRLKISTKLTKHVRLLSYNYQLIYDLFEPKINLIVLKVLTFLGLVLFLLFFFMSQIYSIPL